MTITLKRILPACAASMLLFCASHEAQGADYYPIPVSQLKHLVWAKTKLDTKEQYWRATKKEDNGITWDFIALLPIEETPEDKEITPKEAACCTSEIGVNTKDLKKLEVNYGVYPSNQTAQWNHIPYIQAYGEASDGSSCSAQKDPYGSKYFYCH